MHSLAALLLLLLLLLWVRTFCRCCCGVQQ
jgi:hypothetical protein